jgi:hypothetical protein
VREELRTLDTLVASIVGKHYGSLKRICTDCSEDTTCAQSLVEQVARLNLALISAEAVSEGYLWKDLTQTYRILSIMSGQGSEDA